MEYTRGIEEMENAYSGIAKQANKHEKVQTLMHYVNKRNLQEEHELQKRGKATGVDGVSKEKYEEALETNIEQLLIRMKQFSYRPQAVRRTYIPKAGSEKMRPLGIPAYEDKLVQGVMCRVLNEVYEGKFYEFSYGFREERSCHQALRKVNEILSTKKVNYVVDADIKGFFDNVDHKWMMKFLEHDIGDKNFLRYVTRFLKAGVIENMKKYESDKGTPQGGLVSPVLANVYLHYIVDMWFDKIVTKRSEGEAHIVRYADDFVCFFQYEGDARRFYKALKERLKKFGLQLAEEKSKIIKFGRFARVDSKDGRTESFDFLGFTIINGISKNGKFYVLFRTSKKKLLAKRQAMKEWLRKNMHGDLLETINRLNRKLIGHYVYYGVKGNYQGIKNFYKYAVDTLYKTLTRRSQRAYLSWRRYRLLLRKHPIVMPQIYADIWK